MTKCLLVIKGERSVPFPSPTGAVNTGAVQTKIARNPGVLLDMSTTLRPIIMNMMTRICRGDTVKKAAKEASINLFGNYPLGLHRILFQLPLSRSAPLGLHSSPTYIWPEWESTDSLVDTQ